MIRGNVRATRAVSRNNRAICSLPSPSWQHSSIYAPSIKSLLCLSLSASGRTAEGGGSMRAIYRMNEAAGFTALRSVSEGSRAAGWTEGLTDHKSQGIFQHNYQLSAGPRWARSESQNCVLSPGFKKIKGIFFIFEQGLLHITKSCPYRAH